jgi:hypothetical protein
MLLVLAFGCDLRLPMSVHVENRVAKIFLHSVDIWNVIFAIFAESATK